MAGFYFGTSRWDNIPQTLGLSVVDGVMKGLWQGSPVRASFTNRYNEITKQYYDFTRFYADLDPPLGVEGVEHGEMMGRIASPSLQADTKESGETLRLHDFVFSDSYVYAEHADYVSNPEFYRAAFDVLTSAAKTIMERRAKDPPEWERAIASEWPALAQAWKLNLDVRRGVMWGSVGGLDASANVVVREGHVMTFVYVKTPLPPENHLSLTHQKSGFWAKLFRGQDIIVGDPEFDAAFVIKGEPKEFVHTTLSATARERIKELLHTGTSITLERGVLSAWKSELLTNREDLEGLLKASSLAVEALCDPKVPVDVPTPYR